VDNGTFGTCLVDGGPIEEKRLDAAPWTPRCETCFEGLTGGSRLYPKLYPLSGAFGVIWYENAVAKAREFEPVFAKPTRLVRLDSRSPSRSC
jgi:hypothetical protein